MSHRLDEHQTETLPAAAKHIDLRLGIVILDVVGEGVQADAVFQMIVCNLLTVECFLRTFADNVECPFLVVLGKEVEGVDEQVEPLVAMRKTTYGEELLGRTCRRSAWL